MDLTGKTAIVTGASSGIGAATARKLREAGVRVVGGARRVERVEADLALPLDVMDEESAAAFVGRAADELEGVDILFNNAGLALGRYPFTESNPEDEQTVLHTNVDGVLRMTRLCLPHVNDEGHILFMDPLRAGRRTRTLRRTSPRSSRFAASSTRCVKICSVAPSGSRPSTPGSSSPSSRSSAIEATPMPRERCTKESIRSPRRRSRTASCSR